MDFTEIYNYAHYILIEYKQFANKQNSFVYNP